MSWIDDLLTSSLIVWIIIIFGIVSIYLKKTGKTLPEAFQELREFFGSFTEDKK